MRGYSNDCLVYIFTGIISQKQFFKKCTFILSNVQSECMELLAKYEIVLNLGESHYFIPSLVQSDLQHSPVLTDAPINIMDSRISPYVDDNSSDNGDVDDDDMDHVNDDNGINLMVDPGASLADDGNQSILVEYSRSSSSPSTSSDVLAKFKLPADTDTDLQPTWPELLNFDLLASRSLENTTSLFSTYKHKEDCYRIMDYEIDVIHYPPLCRIWLSPFIPKSFWFRLISRVLSGFVLTKTLLKLLPNIDSSCMDDKNFSESLWSLWQHGVAVMHEDITFLELKCEDDIERNGEATDRQKRQKILVLVNIPEFVVHHQMLSITDPDLSLPDKDVLSQTTKLLVLIEQHILEMCESFPGTITEDVSGGVMSYIPCCFCLQNKSSFKQFIESHDGSTIISYDDHELYCFSFTKMLASYSGDTVVVCPRHGKILVHLCAPDIVSQFLILNKSFCVFI